MTMSATPSPTPAPEAAQPTTAAALALPAPSGIGAWLARHWQRLVALAAWGGLILAYVAYTRAAQLGPLAALQAVVTLMQASAWGPLIYIALYCARPLVMFSATLLTLAGGFIFGPVWGMVYTVLAANLSALVAYGMGRYFGEGFLDLDRLGGIFQHYTARLRQNSFATVLIMRFIFLPYDMVGYVAGLLRVDWRGFLIATIVGCLPGTISFVLAGASLEGDFSGGLPRLNPWALGISIVVFVLSLVLSRLVKRREQIA
jgi:uncharacterized membrane protein YdjX (TVP38/TMEM64 family)